MRGLREEFESMRPTRLPLSVLLLASISPSVAQGPPPAAVGYVEARSLDLRGEVRLPGRVVSRFSSVVAGEIAGKVVSVDVQDGERVKRGDVLVRLRTQAHELLRNEAVARLEEAQARVALAESRLKRVRELFRSDTVSQQDLDDAVSEDTAWREREAQNRAQIDQLDLTLELLNVRAPFDGVVTRKLTEVGQWIVSGGPVVDMVSLDRLEVRVDVPERYFGALHKGVTAGMTFESLPGVTLTGTVNRIVPNIEDPARTFPVKISIADEGGRLAVGLLASVALPLGGARQATIVPKDAIVRSGPGEVVYRIGTDGTAEMVAVTTGAGSGEWIAVTGGLTAGDKIVVRGNERLAPGQAVEGSPHRYAEP
jgi:RND family efflux transporter MFP subunit